MTAASDVRAINCTSCGAGQNVLGGGRVQTHVCPYCGTALDAQDGFQIIEKYLNLKRPDTPLSLGDAGEIDGVPFTIIGIAGLVESYGGETWRWVDHQLFSPTHGYAWLTREDTGHYVFTRRIRDQPNFWLTSRVVESSDSRPSVWLSDERYAYYETSTYSMDYLEGAFNWTPKLHSEQTTVSLVGNDGMIGLTTSGISQEREVDKSRILTADEAASFGITDMADPRSHPLGAPSKWEGGPFYKRASLAFLGLTVLALLVTMFFPTKTLTSVEPTSLSQLPIEVPFELEPGTNLIEVRIGSDVSNGWAYFDFELMDDEDNPIAIGGQEVSYYTGRDADGSWSEGSRSSNFTFRATEAVNYVLFVEMSEFGSGEIGTRRTNSWFSVEIRARNYSGSPIMLALILFVLVTLGVFGKDLLSRNARFKGSDWSSE